MDLSYNQIEAALIVLRARQFAAIDRRGKLMADFERINIELEVLATMTAELIEQQRRVEEANPCK